MIVVLDTHVLVSGLLSPHGPPGRILDWVIAARIQLAFDDRILHEYRDVVARPRFRINPTAAQYVLAAIELGGRPVFALPLDITLPDPGDQAFLEVASAAGPVPLVTGNQAHFADARPVFDIPTPRELVDRLR